jgi:hypothetical protein
MDEDAQWTTLPQATRFADRATLMRWCRDGVVTSRVKRRVSHIRDDALGSNHTIYEENCLLEAADWNNGALGNLKGLHWDTGNAHVDLKGYMVPTMLGMGITGGALYGIELRELQLAAMLKDTVAHGARTPNTSRAPSVKAGRAPTDEQILAKADEMKARGLDGRTIAAEMRHEVGFADVATTTVRALILRRWKPGGRPKSKCSH